MKKSLIEHQMRRLVRLKPKFGSQDHHDGWSNVAPSDSSVIARLEKAFAKSAKKRRLESAKDPKPKRKGKKDSLE